MSQFIVWPSRSALHRRLQSYLVYNLEILSNSERSESIHVSVDTRGFQRGVVSLGATSTDKLMEVADGRSRLLEDFILLWRESGKKA